MVVTPNRYPEPSSDLVHTEHGIPFPAPSPVNMPPQKHFPLRREEKIETLPLLEHHGAVAPGRVPRLRARTSAPGLGLHSARKRG